MNLKQVRFQKPRPLSKINSKRTSITLTVALILRKNSNISKPTFWRRNNGIKRNCSSWIIRCRPKILCSSNRCLSKIKIVYSLSLWHQLSLIRCLRFKTLINSKCYPLAISPSQWEVCFKTILRLINSCSAVSFWCISNSSRINCSNYSSTSIPKSSQQSSSLTCNCYNSSKTRSKLTHQCRTRFPRNFLAKTTS